MIRGKPKAVSEVYMSREVGRVHSAVKHGAYSATAVLPGESQAEFEELHRELISELCPSGAIEDDAVANIARLMWRKKNLRTLSTAELAQERYSEILTRTRIHRFWVTLGTRLNAKNKCDLRMTWLRRS